VNEGASFGAYRAVRKIGQGGMGEVYLGEHALIGRRAAIKLLRRERTTGDALERFFTEARATSAMEDPGIVQIYDFGVTDAGVAYLVMEYLDGESLAYRLRRRGKLGPHEAVRLTRQLAGSLAATHTAGIVHRDLKPENVFIVRDSEAMGGERPKILDFGIAKLEREATSGTTRAGQIMGTPAYMSPEQCTDAARIDFRTDIYSLGCVLFHMLTGRPPFDDTGIGTVVEAHLVKRAPAPSAIASSVPTLLDPIVARCLAKKPDDRFASMAELQQACDAALAQLPASAASMPDFATAPTIDGDASTSTIGNSFGESRKLHPARVGVWAGIAIAAVAAGVVIAVMTTRSSSPATTPAPPAAAEPKPTVEPIVEPPAPPPPAPAAQPPVDAPAQVVAPPPAPAHPPKKKPPPKQRTWVGDPYAEP
jgi:serine/threonine-protein kinase